MNNYYKKQAKKHFKLYEKYIESGEIKKALYHKAESLNYEKASNQ